MLKMLNEGMLKILNEGMYEMLDDVERGELGILKMREAFRFLHPETLLL